MTTGVMVMPRDVFRFSFFMDGVKEAFLEHVWNFARLTDPVDDRGEEVGYKCWSHLKMLGDQAVGVGRLLFLKLVDCCRYFPPGNLEGELVRFC